MNSTVSTKYAIPHLDSRLVLRPRILARYREGLRCKLTLVAGPAGYGKTTSAAMWLQSLVAEGSPGAWYALDPVDDNYSTFFTRFLTAIETALPGTMAAVARGWEIEMVQPAAFANSLAEACLQLPQEVVLVLDDYHVISTPEIHAVLTHLIQYASSRLHLVVVSRHDPPLGISRLRVQQQVSEVRVTDLRMTDEEVAGLLDRRLSQAPPPEVVALLQARTEGWAAGLQLAAVSLAQESAETFLEHFQRHDNEYVLDFLLDEVLEKAPVQVREFLLKTALVMRFTVELAVVLTGFDSALCRQILERLRQQNMFLVPLDQERTWYRYHHQFRAMLLNRARVEYPDTVIRGLRCDATTWLESHGWSEEALAEYVTDANWEKAADLIETQRHLLQNRQEWHLLWRRVQQLPPEVVARRPGLLLAKAWVLHLFDRIAALPALVEQAAALLAAPAAEEPAVESAADLDRLAVHGTPRQVMWGEINALRGGPYRPDVPPAQRLALVTEALLSLTPVHRYEWVRGFAYIALVHVLLAQGQRDEAHRQVLREIEATDLGSGLYLVRLYHALGNVYYYDGAVADLEQMTARYLELALLYELPTAVGFARYGASWALYQGGAAGEQVFAAVAPIFERLQGVHLFAAMLALPLLVEAAAEIGEAAGAHRAVELVRRTALDRENMTALDNVAAAEATLALLQQDVAAAMNWAKEFLGVKVSGMIGVADLSRWALQVFTCAKILIAHGTPAQIEQIIPPLQSVTESARSRGLIVEVIQGAVLLACCCWRIEQPVRALRWMQEGLELGMARGFRRVYYEQEAAVAKMLHTLVQRRVCVEEATLLLSEMAAWSSARQGCKSRGREAAKPPADLYVPLTEREAEVLALLAEKLSNKEIARKLSISTFTVRNHTARIYEKLNVASRAQALAQAKALHLLP